MHILPRNFISKATIMGITALTAIHFAPVAAFAGPYDAAFDACNAKIDETLGSEGARTDTFKVKSSGSRVELWLDVTVEGDTEKRAFCKVKRNGELLSFGLTDDHWSSRNRKEEIGQDL